MAAATNPLVKFWSGHQGAGFHRLDHPKISPKKFVAWSRQDALTHLWDYDNKKFRSKLHENLFPVPYSGNLTTARVFILTQNPGFKPSCYFEDHDDAVHKRLLLKNLKQQVNGFMAFDPSRARSGGFPYWRRWFHPIVTGIADSMGVTPDFMATKLAPFIAAIELCPYHSVGAPGRWAFELPSASTARRYVHDHLIPRAKTGDITLVCVRAAKRWDIHGGKENILVRPAALARSSAFTQPEQSAILRALEDCIT